MAIMYAWYMPKDQPAHSATGSGHRHEWENTVVWVSDDSEENADPCPYCGGRLVRREDDEPETVRRRLATYAAFAEPVTELYRSRLRFATVDGLRHPDAVTAALCAKIEYLRDLDSGQNAP